jgi:Low-density lipoprotein receptor repeat class B
VKRSIEHAFVGLTVVAIVTGGAGQWEALGDGTMYWTDLGDHKIQRVNLDGTGLEDLVTTGLTRQRDKIILFAQDCRWKGYRSWASALLVGGLT